MSFASAAAATSIATSSVVRSSKVLDYLSQPGKSVSGEPSKLFIEDKRDAVINFIKTLEIENTQVNDSQAGSSSSETETPKMSLEEKVNRDGLTSAVVQDISVALGALKETIKGDNSEADAARAYLDTLVARFTPEKTEELSALTLADTADLSAASLVVGTLNESFEVNAENASAVK